MEQKQNPRRSNAPKPRAGRPSGGKPVEDAGFDLWLEAKLKGAYSSVLDEPIPEDLIQLLSEKLKD